MKTKRRLLIPVLLCILLIGSLAYGGWVWFDGNIDRSGWKEENGRLYYQDFHGELVSGWQNIEGLRYYFREDGSALTGWQDLTAGRYHFDGRGAMSLGWQRVEGNTYYFGDDGIMRSGWMELEGKRYYLQDGILVVGWQMVDGQKFYFTANGPMAVGFASIDGTQYYFNPDGSMVTGEAELLGQQYYFSENGAMHFGWLEREEGKQYYLPEGPLAVGWQVIGDNIYCFQESGYARTGWHQEGEYRFYFQEDGTAAVGPTQIDGITHYFTPKGMEVVLVNAEHKVPEWYKTELVTIFDHHQADARCYDALMEMLDGIEDAGIEYEFNSAYRTIKTQREILSSRTQIYVDTYELTYNEAQARALRTVALPGTSEHHLGLAVDLLGEEAQAWLHENCWDYGFIVRYGSDKERWTGISSEPWHFRYVGREIALELKENGLSLEEYLGADPVKPWME